MKQQPTTETRTCLNCRHRIGRDFRYAHCVRTGFYCTIELSFGGRCAGPRGGIPQMNLWEQQDPPPPRKTAWMRIKSLFGKETTC